MDESQALEKLAGILARPEFQAATPRSPWQAVWEAIANWLYDVLVGLFQPIRAAASGRELGINLAIMAVALVLLGVLAAFVARAVGLSVGRDAAGKARAAAARRERSDEHWRRAQELAEAGQFPEAARALYLSALHALEEHAVLRVQAALTNREHADRVAREHPELNGVFATLVQRYDRIRYGNHPIDRETFSELCGLVERTRALTA
jgi:hypothetical protein